MNARTHPRKTAAITSAVLLLLIHSPALLNSAPQPARSADEAWARVPEILKRIVPPSFPARDFPITDHGAVGDGKTDCTQAIREAIAACSRAGGGRVVVPAGTFLTGAIHLQSNVNLHLTRNAVLRFSTDPDDFLPAVFARFESTEVMNYSPFIYAFEQENIAVTGEGTLDGQGSKSIWHEWKQTGREDEQRLVRMGDQGVPVAERVFGASGKLRPNFVQPIRCLNVLIKGVRFVDSPMWVINPVYCTNVTVRGVTVDSKGRGVKAPNTDGCNPESSTDVLIENCVFNTDDDCIAIKAGSETAAGIRGVFAENCSFDSPDLKMAIRIKTNPRRGGFVEDFHVRHCTVKTAITGIHMTMRYDKVVAGGAIPSVRNISIRNVTFENLQQAVFIEGLSDAAKITNVTIEACEFRNAEQPSVVTHADGIRLIDTQGAGLDL